MLIICPECGREVSDKAENCIHCGCPMSLKIPPNHCKINGTLYDFSDIVKYLPLVGDKNTDVHPLYIYGRVLDKTPLDRKSCDELSKIMIETQSIPESYEGVIDVSKLNKPVRNIPTCPTCKSTNIQPISGTERAVSVIGLGMFSKKINKSFKCLDCKSTW